MPRGHKGEKRPADVIGNAVHVMRVATGEIEEKSSEKNRYAVALRTGLCALTNAFSEKFNDIPMSALDTVW